VKDSRSDNDKPAGVATRRGVVKGLALGAGGATLTQWSKPMIQAITQPAHALTTGGFISQPGSGGTTFEFSGEA